MSKLRDFANGQGCVRCGIEDGTVVSCHYTGVRRLDYGGGFGVKVNDWLVAELCAKCHRWIDTNMRTDKTTPAEYLPWMHSEEFLHLIMLTLLRRAARGVVRVA